MLNHLTGVTMQAANLVDYNKWMATKNSCRQLKKSCQKENQEGQVALGLDRSPEFVCLQFIIHVVCLFVCLYGCFTSQVNSYGHSGTVSSPNHTFSWQA